MSFSGYISGSEASNSWRRKTASPSSPNCRSLLKTGLFIRAGVAGVAGVAGISVGVAGVACVAGIAGVTGGEETVPPPLLGGGVVDGGGAPPPPLRTHPPPIDITYVLSAVSTIEEDSPHAVAILWSLVKSFPSEESKVTVSPEPRVIVKFVAVTVNELNEDPLRITTLAVAPAGVAGIVSVTSLETLIAYTDAAPTSHKIQARRKE